jgi:ferredoxin
VDQIGQKVADKNKRYPENKPGRWYVDKECINCDACMRAAPDNFIIHEDDGHAYVVKQPDGPVEEELCREAMEGCPVEAIGNDGDPA